ncbi:MAG TPA: quinoprotein dehydrogenase-associated SoxYZ-like carrier [Burkholderiaceae bacterium]|jgi:sulfur-oxidizing protein SoxY|nr:quinoprotein dehydrogenase-associated SoxYZ-like carrier [Burkholderiaceae bacterium]
MGRISRIRPIALGAAVLIAAQATALVLAPARAQDAETAIWHKVREAQFAGRSFEAAADQVVTLEAPDRAEDAAVVPVLIRAVQPQQSGHWIRRIYLVIDRNPSPLGAVFTLTPESGRADIETRIRIEDYTWVRAIAETQDGKLYMAMKYVKAAGGCSAPAGKDLEAAMARLGRMKFRTEGNVALNQPNLAELMISHPNVSGLAMDQVTRLYAPPRFVRTVQVSYAGKPVMSADVDFTISENPNFRFYFVPRGDGDLKAEVVDSSNATFETSSPIRSAVAAGS